MNEIGLILVACFGSSLQELSFWFDAREKLSLKKYRAMMKSIGYWVVTILMIVGSGIGTFIWCNFDPSTYEAKDVMLFGAAFPLVFKKAVGSLSRGEKFLGKKDISEDENFSFSDNLKVWK